MAGFNHFKEISAAMDASASQIIRKTALTVVAGAKTHAPVDTGALKNSIEMQDGESDLEKVVIVGVEYGPFVEFGTVHMGAQPYLMPAAIAAWPGLVAAMKKLGG